MCDLWMDVDTALSEVPVNIMPLLDDTDFKSREESVAYNAAGLELIWHFTTTAGATTATVVTPTTGGAYDWAHQDGGMYTIEIPASGGASINNDTEGFGWFTGVATGVLPWRGPVIGFRAAAINNALIDGGDYLDTNTVQWAGTDTTLGASSGLPDVNTKAVNDDPQTAIDLADFADTGYDPATHKVQGVVLTDTCTTNTDMRGTNSAALASVCTETRLAELDAANLPADIAAIPTNPILDTEDGSSFTAIPDMATATNQATIAGYIDTEIGTIITHLTDIKGATFSGATDSLEAIRNQGDSAWITATGFSTHDAAAVVTALGDGSTLTACLTATGFSTFNASSDKVYLGNGAHGGAAASIVLADYSDFQGAAGDPWSTALPGAYGAGTAGYIVGTNLDATVSSRGTGAALDAAGVRTAVGLASANLDTQLTALSGYVDCLPVTLDGSTFTALPAVALTAAYDAAKTAAPAGTALSNATWTDAKAAFINAAIDSRQATVANLTNAVTMAAQFATMITLDGAVYDFTAAALGRLALGAAERNAIADAMLARDVSNAEPTGDEHTLRMMLLMAMEANTEDNAGFLTVYQTDGTTEVVQKTLTTDADADPVTGVS